MNISPNAHARFKDGMEGRVTRLIFDPVVKNLTHIVVRVGHLDVERLIPVAAVESSDENAVHITLSEEEFHACETFKKFEFIPDSQSYDPLLAAALSGMDDPFALAWPYVPSYYPLALEVDRIPPGELAFRKGTPVDAVDGHVGHVGAFVVDKESGHMTHVLLEHGHLWGHQEVAIPLSGIDRFEDDRVTLSLTKAQVESLPEVPVAK